MAANPRAARRFSRKSTAPKRKKEEVIPVPQGGVALFQAAQEAQARFQSWINGWLSGQEREGQYDIRVVENELVAVKVASEPASPPLALADDNPEDDEEDEDDEE